MSEYMKMDMVVAKQNKEECSICCEFINKSNRKKVICPIDKCKMECCKECFKVHLMNSGTNPTCMSLGCKKDLSDNFVESNMTQKAFNDYKNYTTDLRIEMVKGQLPQWQEQANSIIRQRKYKEEYKLRLGTLEEFGMGFSNVKILLSYEYAKFNITKSDQFTKKCNQFFYNSWQTWLSNSRMRCSLCDDNGIYMVNFNCKKCNLIKCRSCASFCLLLNDSDCVICNNEEFTIEQVMEFFPKAFFTKFFKPKNRRQNKPEMTACKLNAIELIKKKIDLNKRYTDIAAELYKIYTGETYNNAVVNSLNNNIPYVEKKERTIFIKKCPNSDCKGFLTTAWRCGLCDDFFCSDCNAKKKGRTDEEHVCIESEKATMEMLKKDTKPCPKCGTPIIRFTGCDHMFTPCCNTGFNWKTGEIIANSRNTSPEYYEYMRRVNNGVVPRDVGDDPCGGMIDFYRISSALFGDSLRNECLEYYRVMEHVRAINLPNLAANLDTIDNSELGIKYLIGDIDDKKWRDLLKKKIKKEKRENEIYHILNMYLNVMTDLFQILMDDRKTDKFVNSVIELIKYSNEQIQRINNNYKSRDNKYLIRAFV
jgi:hypothetical protein